MRKGILKPLREQFMENTESKKERVKKRIVKYFLTPEERTARDKELRKKSNKRHRQKHGNKNLKKHRKKNADLGLVKIEFNAVPKDLKIEIDSAFKKSGFVKKAMLLEKMFRAWEGYKNL